MSTMILAMDWVKANPIDCVVYLSFACSWLVGLTDTPDDDKAWGKTYRVIELIGGTTLKAKQQSIRSRFSKPSLFGKRFF